MVEFTNMNKQDENNVSDGSFSCDAKKTFVGDKPTKEKEEFALSKTAEDERDILEFWNENNIFKKSIENRNKEKEFIFYDGPPFATGAPHYGHLLPGTIKDVIPRYKTMKGYKVNRNWGWDCHGLPIENMIEAELSLNSKKDIEEYGIGKFNKKARDSVMRYDKEWKEVIPKTGRWVDMENHYKTMDSTYTESLWWAFSELNKKELVSRDFKPMHICPRCETTLSNNEVTDGYKDIKDLSVTAKFELTEEDNTFILAWTTTPWTLPGNVALAVADDLDYVKVSTQSGEKYIFAKALFDEITAKIDGEVEIVDEFKGRDLEGKEYRALFDYYINDSKIKNRQNGWRVITAPFVTAESGTGVVHIAPAFGEDDLAIGQEKDLPFIQHVGMDGKFRPEVTDFAGLMVRKKDFPEESDVEIIKYLAKEGKLFDKEKYEHSYPHCWRCKTPLLNYATSSWFINSPKIKDKLLKENSKISWVPEHIGTKRFHNWLESTRPWAVSRSRYWGAPLPVWENKTTGEYKILGSLEELQKYTKSTNEFFVMRHGQSEANVADQISCVVGQNGDKLTTIGKQQVGKNADNLEKIDLIISSPFGRTKQTAEIVAKSLGLDDESLIFDDRLKEHNFGKLQGRSNSILEEWFSSDDFSFTDRYQDGESYLDIKKRVMDFIYEINEFYEGKNILIVSHHDPLKCLKIGVEGMDNKHGVKLLRESKFENGVVESLNFAPIPHNEEYVLDYHRPYIDAVSWEEEGQKYEFIKEVFDCWFESGAMPFASKHFPFENKDVFDPKKGIGFPADFISESQDQTRGWFNTLLILSTALFGEASFKNVVVSGMILAEDGKKMAKSLKNYPDITYILHKYGGDAMRLYLMTSPAVRSESLAFAEKGVDEMMKKVVMKSKNVLAFYNLYKDTQKEEKNQTKSPNVLDQWIITLTNKLVEDVSDGLENYKLDEASRHFVEYVDDLSTWYIRRGRDRFKGDDVDDRDFALSTTKWVLKTFSQVIAPFAPFMAEVLWKELKDPDDFESVHLSFWPVVKKSILDKFKDSDEIINLMKEARQIVSVGLETRVSEGIKVRQPLAAAYVLRASDKITKKIEIAEIIKDELNIKEIYFVKDKKTAKEKQNIPGYILKNISEETDELAVFLDTVLDDDLKKEGNFREFLRAVQSARKKKKLQVSDVVELKIFIDEDKKGFIEDNLKELEKVAGIKAVHYADSVEDGEEVDINGIEVKFLIVV